MELPTPEDLKNRREYLNLTQSTLAERAGVSQPLIARIEGGDVDPRLSTLRRIVQALNEAEGGVIHAEDLMNTDLVSVSPDDSVREAEQKMEDFAVSQLPVIQNGIPIGSISFSDIRHAEGENVGEMAVAEIMSEQFPTASREDSVEKVSNHLDYDKAVIVTEGGEAVGIITEADVAHVRS
ncbi:CBS domain-containing protein [Salinirarus marinus]|uniref:CBS domain-containing protein n=1 Tax=Salinirarus marinus TaxID=3068310 RepID=UPI003C6C13B1